METWGIASALQSIHQRQGSIINLPARQNLPTAYLDRVQVCRIAAGRAGRTQAREQDTPGGPVVSRNIGSMTGQAGGPWTIPKEPRSLSWP